MPQNSQHLPIGHILGGHYEIIKILGQGGFGIVYKVKDRHQLDKILIIKELFIQSYSFRKVNESTIYSKSDAKNLIEKIKKDVIEEVNLLSKIRNRNIVQAYGYFEENNTIYSVMEFIYGVDLMEYIKSNSFDEESVKELLFQLIDGLKELHSQNIIHRDIKPQNIMRTNEGVYKLIDFTNNKSYTDHTITISGIITQGYTPPELMGRKGRVGAYSDIYSLGMTLYTLLSLKYPPVFVDRMFDDDFNDSVNELNISNEFKNIIKSMTHLKVEKRVENLEDIEKKFNKYLTYKDANKLLEKLIIENKMLGDGGINPKGIKFNNKDSVTSSFSTEGYSYPLVDEKGLVIFFANGEYRGKIFSVQHGIGYYYRHIIGKYNSFLGFPISNEYPTKDGARNDFEGGFIEYSRARNCLNIYRFGAKGTYLVNIYKF